MFINALLDGGVWDEIVASLGNLWQSTGLVQGTWQNFVMIAISFVLFYLAIVKKFEPLLMLPIAFGMFICNVPGVYHELFGTKGYIITNSQTNIEIARWSIDEIKAIIFNGSEKVNLEQISKLSLFNGNPNIFNELVSIFDVDKVFNIKTIDSADIYKILSINGGLNIGGVFFPDATVSSEQVIRDFGLFYYIYKGVDWVIFPPIIFLGIGTMTDFGPLIANPKSMIIGAAAQLGIFITFFGAAALPYFSIKDAGAIAIIGGADGPTAIYVTKKLSEELLPAIAIAAYSYMALIPIIQKPIMRLMTTDKERHIRMKQLRTVSKLEKIIFPIAVCLVVGLMLPSAMPLLGMLMLGNLLKESGVTDRLSNTAQNGLMNTVTIFLGVMVGCKATGATFLQPQTLLIIVLGLLAFCMGTMGGLLCAKLMNKISGGQINPLIGSAGVSAVPMAARISQDVGREYDPQNHLLMHAMGPNVAGVIGSAIAAGVLLAICG
ncbi:MAG: sodium ion-translocating decarboxylase subunit beta [Clostridia bacterium]|nr:sodium ion-translocating decarboxylase subunit beta [Clostridia bacterium]